MGVWTVCVMPRSITELQYSDGRNKWASCIPETRGFCPVQCQCATLMRPALQLGRPDAEDWNDSLGPGS